MRCPLSKNTVGKAVRSAKTVDNLQKTRPLQWACFLSLEARVYAPPGLPDGEDLGGNSPDSPETLSLLSLQTLYFFVNTPHYTFHILKYFLILYSHHVKSRSYEIGLTLHVINSMSKFFMNFSIDFYYQTERPETKINNKRTYAVLPTAPYSERIVRKMTPNHPFRLSHPLSQFSPSLFTPRGIDESFHRLPSYRNALLRVSKGASIQVSKRTSKNPPPGEGLGGGPDSHISLCVSLYSHQKSPRFHEKSLRILAKFPSLASFPHPTLTPLIYPLFFPKLAFFQNFLLY